MALNVEGGGKEELKTQFMTREGIYRLMTLSEYSRPNRVGYTSTQGSTSVRLSFVTLPVQDGTGDRICFNIGRELYVFVFKGAKKAGDLAKPIDKKMYKGTSPTCHDFNSTTATADSVSLLIGFSTGQIQLIDPIKKEMSKLFNEERLIDKTKITCIKWVPGSTNQFLVSHSSGLLYLYNEELPCGTSPPLYQVFKHDSSYTIYNCKTKTSRNPLYRWAIGGEGINQLTSINEFAFSPCGDYLAVVTENGYLRVFSYANMELVGTARSYFGGFLCVCWSPDSRYIVVGGEDDLLTIWSFLEKRVVARGMGHQSWINVVAFDPFTSQIDYDSSSVNSEKPTMRYRLGSVGQDTQLCLWDLTEDILKSNPISGSDVSIITPMKDSNSTCFKKDNMATKKSSPRANDANHTDDPMKLIGTYSCPRFDQCPCIEPIICKKIAHERLTALAFREDCFVAACQDGYIYTWARPGKMDGNKIRNTQRMVHAALGDMLVTRISKRHINSDHCCERLPKRRRQQSTLLEISSSGVLNSGEFSLTVMDATSEGASNSGERLFVLLNWPFLGSHPPVLNSKSIFECETSSELQVNSINSEQED